MMMIMMIMTTLISLVAVSENWEAPSKQLVVGAAGGDWEW